MGGLFSEGETWSPCMVCRHKMRVYGGKIKRELFRVNIANLQYILECFSL